MSSFSFKYFTFSSTDVMLAAGETLDLGGGSSRAAFKKSRRVYD
jgi:hypothetical protein